MQDFVKITCQLGTVLKLEIQGEVQKKNEVTLVFFEGERERALSSTGDKYHNNNCSYSVIVPDVS